MAGILPHYLGRAASLLMKICPASKDLSCFPSPESTGQPDQGEEKNPDIHYTKGIPPRHTHIANSRAQEPCGKRGCQPCKQPLGCPFTLWFRWQWESCWHQPHSTLQPPSDGAAVSCLQVPGNLPSHKKTNTKNVSHRFSSPRTMELPQPYGRNYFFLPRAVQKTWIFQWVAMQTFV